MKEDNYSVYNDFEVTFKEHYNKIKNYFLFPIVYILFKFKVEANIISFIGFITAFFFFLQTTFQNSPNNLIYILFVYILFDNLDGSLAEKYGISVFGQLVDNFFDMKSLLIIVMGLAYLKDINILTGLIFVLLYWIIIYGSIVLRFNKIKIFVLRLRIFLFFGFVYNNIFQGNIDLELLTLLLILFQLISVFSIINAFIRNKIIVPKIIIQTYRDNSIIFSLTFTIILCSAFYYVIKSIEG